MRNEKTFFPKNSGEATELSNLAEFLHPLLPDPRPFLLKHVTKTSIAVPALPVIHEIHTNPFGITCRPQNHHPSCQPPCLPAAGCRITIQAASFHDCRPLGSVIRLWMFQDCKLLKSGCAIAAKKRCFFAPSHRLITPSSHR